MFSPGKDEPPNLTHIFKRLKITNSFSNKPNVFHKPVVWHLFSWPSYPWPDLSKCVTSIFRSRGPTCLQSFIKPGLPPFCLTQHPNPIRFQHRWNWVPPKNLIHKYPKKVDLKKNAQKNQVFLATKKASHFSTIPNAARWMSRNTPPTFQRHRPCGAPW